MFGIQHDFIACFQLHFHGSELLGEVAGRSLQQSPCHVHSHLLPGTLGKGNACTQPASDIRHSFVERFLLHRGRDGKPLLPVRVEHGEFHRDDVASVLNRGHQYVEPFAPPRGYSSAQRYFPPAWVRATGVSPPARPPAFGLGVCRRLPCSFP